ncbi:MAG: hypothetical protein RIQ81_719, partial [Pseudomonadota bacterium]
REREADILLSSDLHELVASQTLVMDTGTANIRGFSKAKHVMQLLGVVNENGIVQFHDDALESSGLPIRAGVVGNKTQESEPVHDTRAKVS